MDQPRGAKNEATSRQPEKGLNPRSKTLQRLEKLKVARISTSC
jgi:hypothetical protein